MKDTHDFFWERLRQEEVRILVTTPEGVLLLKRPHPPVWEMPGGAIDPGESPEEAAVRETEEETGLRIRLTGLLGTFRRQGWLGGTVYLYRATPVGGQLEPNEEAYQLAYFSPQCWIRLMLPWHRPYWARALSEPTDAVLTQPVGTRDVLVMVGLTWAHRLGLVRDPLEKQENKTDPQTQTEISPLCPRCRAPLAADGRLCSRCRAPRRLRMGEWLSLALPGILFPPLGLLLGSYALFLSDPFEKQRGRVSCWWALAGMLLWFSYGLGQALG